MVEEVIGVAKKLEKNNDELMSRISRAN